MAGTISSPSIPLWYVHSRSNPTLYHAVTLDESAGFYRCDCADHTYRHRDCWHIRAVQAGIVKQAVRKPLPVAPAPTGNPSAWLYEA